jgi:hypothetical protein
MKWRQCPCGCGRLIGDDERYCRQHGEALRALGFAKDLAVALGSPPAQRRVPN